MTPAARLSAAIDVIGIIEAQRAPAAQALKEWGTAHRFAGSGDRAAIAGLVWDVLRRRASSAYLMDDDSPRAATLRRHYLEIMPALRETIGIGRSDSGGCAGDEDGWKLANHEANSY